jgi:hypothetical protein
MQIDAFRRSGALTNCHVANVNDVLTPAPFLREPGTVDANASADWAVAASDSVIGQRNAG